MAKKVKKTKPKINIKESANNFLAYNHNVRRVRNFSNLTFSYLKKFFLIIFVATILIFAALKFFKPQYLTKINIKFHSYFFHTFGLDKHDFASIEISGNNRVSNDEIINIAKKLHSHQTLQNDTSEIFIKKLAKEIKMQLPWVNKINITRTLPNKLHIAIIEYEPFAIWQNSGQQYVIDKDGNKVRINDDAEFNHLIILSGKNANLHVDSLFNIFTINPELAAKIYSATWIGERRWDIRFENGLLVKLPSNDIKNAWHQLINIYNMPGSLTNLKSIDLRVSNKTYLQYNDNAIKEIKNFKL